VDGTAGRDGVDHRRHRHGHRPGPQRRGRGEPDRVLHGVVAVFSHPDDRRLAVDRVLEGGVLDVLEFRLAVVFDRQLGRRPVDGGGLGDGVGHHRFLGRLSAGDARQHARLGVIRRDLGEPLGQPRGGHVLPRLVEFRGAEPAARQEDVVHVALRVDEQAVAGVGHPEQVRARDGFRLGIALGLDQFGGHEGEVDLRHRGALGGLLERLLLFAVLRQGLAVEHLDLLALPGRLGRLLQVARHFLGHGPAGVEVRRLEPPLHQVQVVFFCFFVEDDEHAGIDDPLQLGVRHGPEHGLAVDDHQEGRHLAVEDPGRVVLHLVAFDRALGFQRRQGCLHAVEGKDPTLRWHFGGKKRQVFVPLILGGREIHPGELEVVQGDLAIDLVHLGPGGHPDHPELVRLRRAGRLDRQGGTGLHAVPLELFQLRLVQDEGHIAVDDLPGPTDIGPVRRRRRLPGRGGGHRRPLRRSGGRPAHSAHHQPSRRQQHNQSVHGHLVSRRNIGAVNHNRVSSGQPHLKREGHRIVDS